MLQTPNYCLLLKIFNDTKTILTVSNYDSQLKIDNTTYVSNRTINFDKVEIGTTLDECNTTLTLVPSPEQKEEILKNNELKVEIFCLKIDNNTNNINIQKIILKRGNIGDIAIEGTKISLEIKSITDILDNKINRRYIIK